MQGVAKMQGVVLVTVLLFLSVMSLLVLSSIESHLLELKMARHFYQRAVEQLAVTDRPN